ncbi:MAG: aspartate aminotransferase [Shimia sp.]
MAPAEQSISPEAWLEHLFSSKSACAGQVVRRQLCDVIQYVGLDRFIAEIDRRGFTAILNGEQVVIFCNAAPLRRLTPKSLQDFE